MAKTLISIFSKTATGFSRKHFELNFSTMYKKHFPFRLFKQVGKVILTASHFFRCRALNETIAICSLHLRSLVHFCYAQRVTLALARSPREVSKVSGERKSLITRLFGEYDFLCQEII